MTRRDASEAASTARGGWFESALLFALLCLIPIRAVISETQTFEVPRSIRTLDAPAGPSPATTFFIDALIFAAAGLTLALQFWAKRAYRKTGAEWGLAILIVAMIVSTLRAGQKHLAIIGSLDFAAIVFYGITLRQLLTQPWHLRLALTVILATGGMMIAKCGYQKWIEQPETLKYYLEHKGELISANQASPGFVYDYEQRLKSGAVTGFFPHPNVLASYLLLVIMTALAMVRSRWKMRPGWTLAVPLLIAITAFAALIGAQSKGAVAALGLGLLFWLAARTLRGRISPRKAVILVWCLLLAGSAAFAGLLHAKPEALGRSILFRTFYWKAAGRMIHDYPLGVGANNFGRWFTRYKDVECPEDVEDPHSWPVRAAAEWGIPGLAGMLVLFVGISFRLAKGSAQGSTTSGVAQANSLCRTPSIILSSAGIALIVFVFWYAILSDASGAFILLTFHVPLIAWFVVFVGGGVESTDTPRFADDAFPALTAPLVAGLLAFLIHTGIDLAMFTSAPATLFLAVVAIAAAVNESRRPVAPHPSKPSLVGAIIVLAIGLGLAEVITRKLTFSAIANVVFMHQRRYYPAAENWDAMDASGRSTCYNKAIYGYWLDGSSLEELIEELTRRASTLENVDEVQRRVDELAARDPQNSLVPQFRAMLYLRRYELAKPAASQSSSPKSRALTDFDSAITAAREAVAAYPTNPSRRLFLADLLEKRAAASNDVTESKQFNSAAAAELQTALDLESKRIYVSPLHRMTSEQVSQIAARVDRLNRSQ